MIGKKGMSPLIATVLLMAFAVALGGMIMNWSAGIKEGADCGSLDIDVRKACYTDDGVKLDMRSSSEKKIESINLVVETSDMKSEFSLKDSSLGKGASLSREVSYLAKSSSKLKVFPVIEGEECKDPIYEESLEEC